MNSSFGQMFIVLVQYLWNSHVEIIPSIFEYLWVVLCVLSQHQLHIHVCAHCTHTVHHELDSRKCRLFSSCKWFVLSCPNSWPRLSFMTKQRLCKYMYVCTLGMSLPSPWVVVRITKTHYLSNVEHVPPVMLTQLEQEFRNIDCWVLQLLRYSIHSTEQILSLVKAGRPLQGKGPQLCGWAWQQPKLLYKQVDTIAWGRTWLNYMYLPL